MTRKKFWSGSGNKLACPKNPFFYNSSVKKKKPTPFKFTSKEIPTNPGCYLFWDKNEKLLYVGKAKNLRKRVSTYFQKTKKSPRLEKLVKSITKIETRTVNSEMESLILENNLIKEFRPWYNVLLRDDKNFLYLRLTNEDFPRMETTRKIVRDGSFYFGPKTSAKKLRATTQFCQKVFQIRTCRLEMTGRRGDVTSPSSDIESDTAPCRPPEITSNPEKRSLPCLDFHIKKCAAPCSGEISMEEYQKSVNAMKQFLRGNTREVIKSLQEKMMKFAEEKNFEAAGKTRDLIQSIELSTEKQNVQFEDLINRDFIHFEKTETSVFFVRIAFRNGKFLDQNEIEFQSKNTDIPDAELLGNFITQFYERIDEPPREICIPVEIEEKEELESFLSSQFFDDQKIEIHTPQKGSKKEVLQIAQKNAKNFAEKTALETASHAENFAKALPELAEELNLKNPPKRMECYDISHLGGTHTVASQVVFVDGEPKKSEYRRFKVKTLPDGKIDDFASMHEILGRRFSKISVDAPNLGASNIPDLIIIDGGKGQLSAVMKAVKDFKFPKKFDPQTQIIALAKQEEQIFRPGEPDPIELPLDSPALKLLQRIRDEAHRFAISFNRNLREKSVVKSILDEVEGIGPSTKKKLLQTFGSVGDIKKASEAELLKVVSRKQLENLRKVL